MSPENKTIDITIPQLGESITEATLSAWLKSEGDAVEEDEPLAELETDKVSVEVVSPSTGVLTEIKASPGERLKPGDLIGRVAASESAKSAPKSASAAPGAAQDAAPSPETPKASPPPAAKPTSHPPPGPAVRKLAAEKHIDTGEIKGTGKHGQITREDVADYLKEKGSASETKTPPPSPEEAQKPPQERVVPMSPIRRVIARRLLQAQTEAAILTTFNEIDMKNLKELRKTHQEAFLEKHGVKLGYMSFFARACVLALEDFPELGAEIRGEDIIYKSDCNIAIAVGGPKGLAVPVIRRAQTLSIARLEQEIARLAARVRESKITLEELQGGTFSITNGGVYGSMMSTPILNPPQSGILGMHKITDRPVAINGEVVIRPMMYAALSYDHRIVDGKEAVQFLVRIKEIIENPQRLLLDL